MPAGYKGTGMQIIPLAAESLGVRSMCTHVATKDCRVLIDPGVRVVNYRYGLKPHPLEIFSRRKLFDRIVNYAADSDIVIITHFHEAHYTQEFKEIYRNKILLLKNPNHHVTLEQRKEAFDFITKIRDLCEEIHFVDGQSKVYGETELVFSEPVQHGGDEPFGHILQCAIEDDSGKFLFTSDINGPAHEDAKPFIIKQDPEILYLDGPVTFTSYEGSREALREQLERLIHLLEETRIARLILDHHVLRDILWKEKMSPLFAFTEDRGIHVLTAAEFRGEENQMLEARRDRLYKEEPPG